MTYTGAYLIGSQTLRLYHLETLRPSSQWIDPEPNQTVTKWTAETLRERMTKVFSKIVKTDLKCLILVNSTQLSIELLRLAYDVGSLYAKEVHIISATLARLQWAVAETKLNYLNIDGKALIAYFINDLCEFDELVVSSPSTYILNSLRKCTKDRAQEMLVERMNTIKPTSVAFVSTHQIHVLKKWFESRYPNCRFHYIVEKPDYILLNGGLAKAGTIYPGEFAPYDVKTFASGYKIEYTNDNGKAAVALIPFNESLPAKNTVELAKIKSFCVKYNEEITVAPAVPPSLAYGRPQSAVLYENTRARSVRITANINSFGVPYMKVDAEPFIDIAYTSAAPSAAEAVTKGLSTLTMSTTNASHTFDVKKVKFTIKLKANCGSIWSITDNGKEYPLLNVNQNEWTPFFVSFHKKDVKIGEKAEAHSKKYPKSVIKDVHKVIGLPLKKIEIDGKWKFGIVPAPTNDRIKFGMFEVETPEGNRQFLPDAIMSMFLVALKKLAERQFDVEIKNLSIQLASQDYKPDQLQVVKSAAENVGIEVDSIDYMGF